MATGLSSAYFSASFHQKREETSVHELSKQLPSFSGDVLYLARLKFYILKFYIGKGHSRRSTACINLYIDRLNLRCDGIRDSFLCPRDDDESPQGSQSIDCASSRASTRGQESIMAHSMGYRAIIIALPGAPK